MPVFADLIRGAVSAHEDTVAIVNQHSGTQFTYRELDGLFNRLGNALAAQGLTPGDHAAILQRNSHYWIVSEGALAKSGIVSVALNTFLSPAELAWLINHSEAKALIFDLEYADAVNSIRPDVPGCKLFVCVPEPASAPLLEWAVPLETLLETASPADPAAVVRPDDPYCIAYTSATTGLPKGVICTNETRVGSVVTSLANQLNGLRPTARFLVTTPLTHVASGFFWAFFAQGCTSHIMRRYDPGEFCQSISDHGITHSFLAPTMIISLMAHLDSSESAAQTLRDGSLAALWYAGSPIPPDVARRAEDRLGPVLNQQYGLTELYGGFPAMAVTHLEASWHRRKAGSCGRPVIGSVVRVVDEAGDTVSPGSSGEVVIQTLSRVAGYWNKSPEVVGAYEDGWIRTGDIGRFDDDGFLYIHDRKNDMIISGALNVYPAEVESVLLAHAAVQECAVVGFPDPTWVEVPCAAVVKKVGFPEVTEDDLIAFARARIAHYKAPKRIVFVQRLPLSSAGKILRRKVREDLSALVPGGGSQECSSSDSLSGQS